MAVILRDARYKRIVRRLKELRIESGLTQVEVAHNLGIHQVDISRIETFEAQMDILQLIEFCKLYNCSIEKILEV